MKMNIKYKISFLLALAFTFGCDESLLEQDNTNQYMYDSYYRNPAQLTQATNGIYGQFYGADLWGRMMQYFMDAQADEHAAGGTQLEVHNAQLLAGTFDNTIYTLNAPWRGLYKMIHRANGVLVYGPETEGADEGLKKQRLAEAKFLRAYAYYYLTANWGEVPVYTTFATSPSDAKEVDPESVVFNLLETDLTAIQADLDWKNVDNPGRATKGAAKLLLARVLMHQGKFSEAKTVLEDIYKNGPYKLVDNYSDNFKAETEFNDESIFEIAFTGQGFDWSPDGNSTNNRGTVMFQDYSPVAWRNMIPSNKLINEFEHTLKGDAKTDPRLSETVYFTGDTFGPVDAPITLTDGMQNGFTSNFHGTTIKASWKKYSPMYKTDPGGYYISDINYRNMRYAEVLLKLAECENEAGTQAKAIEYLNEIRARASVAMPPYPTAAYPVNSKEEVMKAIMHESMVEFANEKLRILDISRWKKNGQFSAISPDPVNYSTLPYPSEETDRNPNISN